MIADVLLQFLSQLKTWKIIQEKYHFYMHFACDKNLLPTFKDFGVNNNNNE